MSSVGSVPADGNGEEDLAVRERKQALRKSVRSKLREYPPDRIRTESARVWERLFQLEAYQRAKSVGLFLSMPRGEICTNLLIEDATRRGKTMYVPQVGKNFEQADMELLKVDSGNGISADNDGDGNKKLFFHDWGRNKWNIPEPPPDMELEAARPGDIDLLIVPGLAFDRNGDRLGQGKGYYDRFIARMCTSTEKPPPLLVSVGLSCQVVDEDIPVNRQYDRTMDIVLLPDETIVLKEETTT